MSSEKKRSANFSVKEESFLVMLVRKYHEIIENKKTNNITNQQKINCWKTIEEEFNSQNGEVYRDSTTLKKKFENIKKQTKKKTADEKVGVMGTGGGPSQNIQFSEIEIEMQELLGSRVHGLRNEFGDDVETLTIIHDPEDHPNTNDKYKENIETRSSSLYAELASTSQAEHVSGSQAELKDETLNLEVSNLRNHAESHKKQKSDWAKYSAADLKTPKSKELVVKRKRNEYDALCQKVSQWAGTKSSVETEKLKYIEEEHAVKIRLMEQKHEAEIDCLRRESNANVKKIDTEMAIQIEELREQNKLKTEILILEKRKIIEDIQSRR